MLGMSYVICVYHEQIILLNLILSMNQLIWFMEYFSLHKLDPFHKQIIQMDSVN